MTQCRRYRYNAIPCVVMWTSAGDVSKSERKNQRH